MPGKYKIWQNLRRLVVILVLIFAVSAVGVSRRVLAEDSKVYTILCNSEGPDVQVATPISDSTVDSPSVLLSGTTLRTTQLEIFVNGAYSQSIGLEPDGPFNTSVTLSAGTNTIRLEAYFSCNQTEQDFEIVVTYEPAVTPSPGGDTDTKVSPGDNRPTISNPPQSSGTSGSPSFIYRVGDNLNPFNDGWGESFKVYDSVIVPIRSWASLLIGLLAFTTLIFTSFVLTSINKLLGWNINLESRKQLWLVRLLSVVILILSLVVIQLG